MRKGYICLFGWTGWILLLIGRPAVAQETLPPVNVTAPRVPAPVFQSVVPENLETNPTPSDQVTSDTTPVGSYGQPAWTTDRPFASTRSYVIPAGQVDFEQWVRPKWNRHSKAETQFLEELSVGLPGRFQLDVYERWDEDPNDNNQERPVQEGVSIEGRYALADWGVIPLNPTLYAEWTQGSTAEPDKFDKYEFKLLLADEFWNALYYAANFSFEQEIGGERDQELQFSQAFSTTLIERKLLGGVEMVLESNTFHGSRGSPLVEFDIGPSLQWRPTERTFLDVVPLFGTTRDSPTMEMFVIFGINLGNTPGSTNGGIEAPASARGS